MTAESSWPIGVCSWSLQMAFPELEACLSQLQVRHVHLAVGPGLEGPEEFAARVQAAGWEVTSTMIDFPQEDYSTLESIKRTGGVVPDDVWPDNLERYRRAVSLTQTLGVSYLSFHVGHLDLHNPPVYEKMVDRMTQLADIAADADVTMLLETGQESAEDMKTCLEQLNHSAIGLNFDPANMILYDNRDPIAAIDVLAPWIRHVHIKDATATETPGTWGEEVRWGTGDVDETAFFEALRQIGYRGPLAVEREAGDDRRGDIGQTVDRLRNLFKES